MLCIHNNTPLYACMHSYRMIDDYVYTYLWSRITHVTGGYGLTARIVITPGDLKYLKGFCAYSTVVQSDLYTVWSRWVG